MRYSDVQDRKAAHRGLQVYNILTCAAAHHQVVTYGHLAKLMDFKGAGVLGSPLGHVLAWCHYQKLPSLTSLVVRRETGLPGDGNESTAAEVPQKQMQVWSYDWYGEVPPTVDELATAFADYYKKSEPGGDEPSGVAA